MSRRLQMTIPLLLAVLAFALRIGGGPGTAYLHGVGGVGDEPAYIGEGLYMGAALGGRPGQERFFSYTPPFNQTLFSLAPLLSPFRLEKAEIEPATSELALRSPDGRPYTVAYLPAGSPIEALEPALAGLTRGDVTLVRPAWVEEVAASLSRGEAAIVSVLTPGNDYDRSLPVAFAPDPLLAPGPDGLALRNRSSGELIALLRSDGVRSVALAIGADSPLSIVIATIDDASILRVWRMTDQTISPWGIAFTLSHEESYQEASSVAPGPSGDLLLVSARTERGWELLTYETTSSISLVNRLAIDGPLTLEHRPGTRETFATDAAGQHSRLVGGPIAGARLVVALIGALGAALAWLFGRRVGGRRLAIAAGLLFAVDPLGVAMGRIAYGDQLMVTMLMGGVAAMAFALSPLTRHRARWFLAMGLFAGLAVASKLFVLPFALLVPYLGALYLPVAARRTVGTIASGLGMLLIGLGAVGGSAPSLIFGVAATALGVALFRSQEKALGSRPMLLAILGLAVGYAVPWLLRDALLVLSGGFSPFESIIDMHLSLVSIATSVEPDQVSIWWIWPTGVGAFGLEALEAGTVFWAPGVILAAGIAAGIGSMRISGRALALLLLLLWVSWSLPLRHQMPYYALGASVVAGAMIVWAARERPRSGRAAIAVALLAPLAGALAFEQRVETALLAVPFALGGLFAGSLLLRRRTIGRTVAALAWPVASLVALAVAVGHGLALAPLAGAAAALAAAGGWRAAPYGATIAGGLLLVPGVVELVGFTPNGLIRSWTFGDGRGLHPVSIALVLLLFGAAAWSARRAARR